MDLALKIETAHRSILAFLGRRLGETGPRAWLRELFAFGYKESLSCLFPAFIFVALAVTDYVRIDGIPRYDILLALCLAMQVLMVRLGLETKEEVYVICVFHALGVSMEIFKVSHAAWAYPEFAYSKVCGVPLYSGFMYASVASYVCQAWRHFDLELTGWPSSFRNSTLACAIYGNFFTNHYLSDARLILIPLLFFVFRGTWVSFTTNGHRRKMPMMLSFALIAIFIWIAENIGTYFGAWSYPHQGEKWEIVRMRIMSSWFLLVIVSVMIIAAMKRGNDSLDHGT